MRKILGLVVNTLTSHGKYFLLKRDNLLQQLGIHLSQKQNIFSEFFFLLLFWKSRFNFKHFEKKDYRHNWCIFDPTDSEKSG